MLKQGNAPFFNERRRAAMAGALLVLGIAWAAWFMLQNQDQLGSVENTLEVERQLARVLSKVQDAETGQRGYLLTADPTYLQPFRLAQPEIDQNVARLADLTRNNAEQQSAIAALRPLIATKMTELAQTVEMQRNGREKDVLTVVRSNLGRDLMQAIRTRIASMIATEDRLLQTRRMAAASNGRLLLASIAGGLLLAGWLWIRFTIHHVRNLRALSKTFQVTNERLAESEAQIRALANFIPQLAWMARKDGHIFWYNRRWFDFTGTTVHDMQDKGWKSVHHPDHFERVAQRLQQSWNTGDIWEDTFPLRRADGTYRWFRSRAELIRDDLGQIEFWFATNTDVTDSRADETALAASETRFRSADALMRTFIDAVPGVVYAKDRAGRIMFAIEGAAMLVGKRCEEIIGKTDVEFLANKQQAEIVMANDRRIISTGIAEQVEETLDSADGTQTIWLSSKVPLRNENGEIIGLIGSSVDITRRKQADAILARDKAELERLVHERTQSLQETQVRLAHTQRLEALGQLTGGVAHDFNNLLTAILGSLRLLTKQLPDLQERPQRLLNNAISGAERGATLTQRLLAFGRRQLLSAETVDISGVVDGMSELLRSSLGAGVEIRTSFAERLPRVIVDLSQLELALLNLAVNARDAMGAMGVLTISARAEHVDDQEGLASGDYVVISVTDTGEGMDEATLARAVEPFFTTKGVGKGTGLGLSMVHGLAGQSGGKLTLTSSQGHGTTVDLWLPQLRPQAPFIYAPEPSPPALGRRCSVLVVDDDPVVLETIVAMLEDLGHRVVETASGRQALEIVNAEARIDLVLTDLKMPEMSGAELAFEIARLRPGLQIVVMTGHAEFSELAGTGFPVLSKPLDRAILEQIIGPARSRHAGAPTEPIAPPATNG